MSLYQPKKLRSSLPNAEKTGNLEINSTCISIKHGITFTIFTCESGINYIDSHAFQSAINLDVPYSNMPSFSSKVGDLP